MDINWEALVNMVADDKRIFWLLNVVEYFDELNGTKNASRFDEKVDSILSRKKSWDITMNDVVNAQIRVLYNALPSSEDELSEWIKEYLNFHDVDNKEREFLMDFANIGKTTDSKNNSKNNNMKRIKDEEEYVLDRSLDLLDDIANSCIVFLKDLNRQDLSSYGNGSIATVGTNSKGHTYVMYSDGDSKYLEDMTPVEIVETAMIIAGIA